MDTSFAVVDALELRNTRGQEFQKHHPVGRVSGDTGWGGGGLSLILMPQLDRLVIRFHSPLPNRDVKRQLLTHRS